MTYRAPLREIQFLLDHVLDAARVAASPRFADADAETSAAVLAEAAKLAEHQLAPLNRAGDLHPARLENGTVRTSPGFPEGYRAIADGGWIGMAAATAHGGMGMPMVLTSCVNELLASACLSLSLNPLMCQGQVEAIEAHASDDLKALYLPKLISGKWSGTMNLTEPQAGSDVGALSTKAEPNADGSYAITGQKIFISWGDHDCAENIVHLVLARLPDAPGGTKGISLFIVPKLIPDGAGKPGVANSLHVVSLEHKMGLHGSPTAVMAYEGATGWMVGAPGGGMAAMFTMMNNARLGVGIQGLSQAELALQMALAYAADRKQGRSPVADGTGSILDHADVRRNLMVMKSQTQIVRAICLDCAISLDLAQAHGDAAMIARAAFLTPIAKAFGTDTGAEVASLGIQVHGGMGYIEETGISQVYRDARITAIYEGTNGIQAMDLVGRKLADGGAAARALLAEIAETAKGSPELQTAHEALTQATDWMLAADMNDRAAGAQPYLRAFALTLGGHYLAKGAGVDAARQPLADFHLRQPMAAVAGLCAAACEGAAPLYADPLGAT